MCYELERAMLPGGRLVGCCPREHGKSSWGTIILPLYLAATKKKHFIRIFCDTTDRAKEKLSDVFAYIHEENHPLIEDYGSDLMPAEGWRGRDQKFAGNEAILGNGVKIMALHFGAPARGMIHRHHRPDCDIFDDPEDEKNVENAGWRRQKKNYIDRQILFGAGKSHSLAWLGTIVHHDSLLIWLLDPKNGKKNWRRWVKYRDVYLPGFTPGADPEYPLGKTIWPEHWSPERAALKREESGSLAFNQEMRNIPTDPESQRFRHEWWNFFNPDKEYLKRDDRTHVWTIRNPRNKPELKHLKVVMGVDLALGEKKHHDFSCYLVLGAMFVPDLARPLMFILHVERVKISPLLQVDKLRELYEFWRPQVIGIDATIFQQIIAQQAAQAGMPIIPLHAHQRKEERIDVSAIPVEQGLVYVPAKATRSWVEAFCEEAEAYPGGGHDDQLDAFANAQIVLAGGGSAERQGYRSSKRNTLRTLTRGMN